MGKVIDMQTKQVVSQSPEPETLYPDGCAVNGGLNSEGTGILTLTLVTLNPETQQPEPTHTITMLATAWYQVGQLLQTSATNLEIAAVDFRRQHARRLENERKKAHGGLMLPGYISHQRDNISQEGTDNDAEPTHQA